MMKIWVVRQTCAHSNDTYLSTHITEKGALITAIEAVRADMADGLDGDELEDMRPGMPRDFDEDLMKYSSDHLRGIVQDWWEYAWEIDEYQQYQIHQTQVEA